MIRPPCPETRALPRTMSFPWLATLMLGTAVAAFAPAAGAQDTAAPAADASGSAATGEAAAAGDAAATGDAAAGGDAAASGDTAAGDAAATGDAPAAGDAAATAPTADAAAGQPPDTDTAPAESDAKFRQAAATLRSGEGADIGTVSVSETASGVMYLILDISEGALPANAQRAIHIHETGLCEAPTFESAGGHLAGDKEHGVHAANGIHPGDLPNITMGAAGALHVEYFLPGVLMDQILDDNGSAVVVHSEVDDYTTQPSGNAGDRIACGVLELAS